MASSLALKRLLLVSGNLFSSCLRPMRRPASPRLFQTKVTPEVIEQIRHRMEDYMKDRHPPLKVETDSCSGISVLMSVKDDYLQIRLGLAGLGKEDVKVSVLNDTLFIDGNNPLNKTVSTRIEIPKNISYKIDKITSEMNNGMLYVNFPIVKKEKEMFHIKVY